MGFDRDEVEGSAAEFIGLQRVGAGVAREATANDWCETNEKHNGINDGTGGAAEV